MRVLYHKGGLKKRQPSHSKKENMQDLKVINVNTSYNKYLKSKTNITFTPVMGHKTAIILFIVKVTL